MIQGLGEARGPCERPSVRVMLIEFYRTEGESKGGKARARERGISSNCGQKTSGKELVGIIKTPLFSSRTFIKI